MLALLGVFSAIEALLASPAFASEGDVERAEKLFAQGKAELAHADFTSACASFESSFEIDPATGSLLALAICRERQGKLASAVRNYSEVVERAKAEGRSDRARAAAERIAVLRPKLSTLRLELSGDPHALEVRLDGGVIEPQLFGAKLGVDGGVHRVEALHAGKPRFITQVAVAASDDAKTVRIEVPVDAAPAPRAPLEQPAPAAAVREPAPRASLSGVQIAGIVTAAAGVAGLLAAAPLAIVAVNENDDSKSQCDGDLCTARGRELRGQARAAGDAASLSLLVGGAVALVGAAIFFASGPNHESSALAASAWAAPHAAGVDLRGAF